MRGKLLAMVGAGALTAVAIVGSAAPAFAQGSVIANPDEVHTTVNTSVTFDPTANDTVSAPFTIDHIQIESDPSHGTATIQPDGISVKYVPDTDYVGATAWNTTSSSACRSRGWLPTGLQQNCTEATGVVKITVDPAAATDHHDRRPRRRPSPWCSRRRRPRPRR